MAFAPTKPWKLPFITTWGGSPNRNLPTNSAEEAKIQHLGSIVDPSEGEDRYSGNLVHQHKRFRPQIESRGKPSDIVWCANTRIYDRDALLPVQHVIRRHH